MNLMDMQEKYQFLEKHIKDRIIGNKRVLVF